MQNIGGMYSGTHIFLIFDQAPESEGDVKDERDQSLPTQPPGDPLLEAGHRPSGRGGLPFHCNRRSRCIWTFITRTNYEISSKRALEIRWCICHFFFYFAELLSVYFKLTRCFFFKLRLPTPKLPLHYITLCTYNSMH